MIIQVDTRQKKNHHILKEKWFEEHDIKLVHSKCLVGDYIIPSDGSVSVDTKKDISELYKDLIQDHKRFASECNLADELGIQLYVLVENEQGMTKVEDILRWKNPQYLVWLKKQRQGVKCKAPASNQTLLKIIKTMEKKYGVQFQFCHPHESASRIVELLNKG